MALKNIANKNVNIKKQYYEYCYFSDDSSDEWIDDHILSVISSNEQVYSNEN